MHTGKWLNKWWYIHTMYFYAAIKKNEVVLYCTSIEDVRDEEKS